MKLSKEMAIAVNEWRADLREQYQKYMDSNISTQSPEEQFTWVLEQTSLEVNRVLRNWRLSKLIVTRQDVNSVFRSYFAKFVKHKFSYRTYSSLVRWDKPQPIIQDDMLVGIDVHDIERAYPLFDSAMKKFNYRDPKLLPTKAMRSNQALADRQDISDVPLENLIDYAKLESFKF